MNYPQNPIKKNVPREITPSIILDEYNIYTYDEIKISMKDILEKLPENESLEDVVVIIEANDYRDEHEYPKYKVCISKYDNDEEYQRRVRQAEEEYQNAKVLYSKQLELYNIEQCREKIRHLQRCINDKNGTYNLEHCQKELQILNYELSVRLGEIK